MQRLQSRIITVFLALIVFGAFTWYLSLAAGGPDKTYSRVGDLPLKIGKWKGTELKIDPFVMDILETEYVMQRIYSDNRHLIDLTIVFYKDSRVSLHLPESCLAGQGSKIVSRTLERIPAKDGRELEVNRIDLDTNAGRRIFFYFFEAVDKITHSYAKMRWYMMVDKLLTKSNSGALVRISIDLGKDTAQDRVEILREFAGHVIELLPKYLT